MVRAPRRGARAGRLEPTDCLVVLLYGERPWREVKAECHRDLRLVEEWRRNSNGGPLILHELQEFPNRARRECRLA